MTGMGLAFGNIMTNGQKQLSLEEQPDANAIFNTLQQFAGAVGTTLASLIVAMSQANQKMDFTQATAKGSRNGFMVLFALGIFQLLLLFWVVGKEQDNELIFLIRKQQFAVFLLSFSDPCDNAIRIFKGKTTSAK